MTPTSEQSDDPLDFALESGVRRQRLWKYFRPYTALFVVGAIFLVLTNLMALAIPSFLGDAIEALRTGLDADDAGQSAIRDQVIRFAGIIIALAIGAGIARIFSRITIFNAARHIEFDVRNALYTHLARLTPKFFGAMPTGDLTSRVTNDVSHVRLLYALPFLHIINAVVAYSIAIYRMLDVDWLLTVIALSPYPFLLFFGVRHVIRALFDQTKVVQSRLSDLSTKVQENLSGIDVIKSYVLEEREKKTYAVGNETFYVENVKLAKIRAMLNALIVLIASTGTLVVLIVGSQRVINDQMSLGAFVEFNGYVVALVFPTIALGWVFAIWHRGLAAFDRVSELLEHDPDLKDPDDPREFPPTDGGDDVGRIEIDDLSFSYGDDEAPALRDISLQIPAGSTVAIVGKTGSGKSTLVKLIARLYDPDDGQIRVDGIPLQEVALRHLRSEIGFVPQEPFLFSMTVGQNIRFGVDALAYDRTIDKLPPDQPLLFSKNSTDGSVDDPQQETIDQDERILQAIEVAALQRDINGFQEGLDTLVGERGVTLSGGQKQRATIARALLVDPRILILDDALASVDTRTERKILDHLDQIMAGRTSILLTHRFNALTRVDQIFVLDQGRLIESGTHDELIEAGGHYADMYQRQKLREQLSE